MKDKSVNVQEVRTYYCYSEAALKDENDRIDKEGIDKFSGTDECKSGKSVFDILDSIQAKPGLFQQVFKL